MHINGSIFISDKVEAFATLKRSTSQFKTFANLYYRFL